jgi:hypothetical protein
MTRGDLAYVPSEVFLYQLQDGTPTGYHKLSKPSSVIIIDKQVDAFTVLFEGQTWSVDSRHLYPMEDPNHGNSQIYRSV